MHEKSKSICEGLLANRCFFDFEYMANAITEMKRSEIEVCMTHFYSL